MSFQILKEFKVKCREIYKELGLRTNVELVEKGTIERFVLKAKRVVDLRDEI